MSAGPDRARRAPVRGVLVDLDGTLLDTAGDLAAAADAMLVELGRNPLGESRVREFVGKGIAHLVHRCLEATGPVPADESRALAVFSAHYDRTNGAHARMYPGVRDGLAEFRAMRLAAACVTNKASRFTVPLLAATGLSGFFDAVITADLVGSRKPDPAIMLHACGTIGVQPEEAVVIGDSDNDGEAARAAGCTFLLVPYGYREGLEVHALASDGIVDSILHAADWIRSHRGAAGHAR